MLQDLLVPSNSLIVPIKEIHTSESSKRAAIRVQDILLSSFTRIVIIDEIDNIVIRSVHVSLSLSLSSLILYKF